MQVDLPAAIDELNRAILKMGAAVEHRVKQSITSMLQLDSDTACAVRFGDDEIDQMETGIEELCLKLLALNHPVAGDLRFILSVMRINKELERAADLAKSIAKRALDLVQLAPLEAPSTLVQMAEETQAMFSDAIRTFADRDTGLARDVRRRDQIVDDLYKEMFAWVQELIHSDIDQSEAAIDYVSIAGKLERIADIATNVAKGVIFLAEGAVFQHTAVNPNKHD